MSVDVKDLVEQIHKLNKHLDERVKTIEERQSKTETKISQGGPVAAEARAELNKINDAISNEIKEYRKLVLEQKEAMLAMQRPPPTNGYRGSAAGAFKPLATHALEKWMRKGGDVKTLTIEERCYIDYNLMIYNQISPTQTIYTTPPPSLSSLLPLTAHPTTT